MKKQISLLFLLVVLITRPLAVYASTIELEISGNGSESQSQIETSLDSSVQITQQNDTHIQNDVDSESNTGDNTANANTNANASINTGDINESISVKNNVNQNQLDLDTCCDQNQPTDLSIIQNGSGSDNSITHAQTNPTTITQQNVVIIENNIVSSANTGNNQILGNTGNQVALTTGDINQQINVQNIANTNQATISTPGFSTSSVKIKSNGEGSSNHVALAFGHPVNYQSINQAFILNQETNSLNTGGNLVAANTADVVTIYTGHITKQVSIKNIINQAYAKINLCCQEKPTNGDDDDDPNNGDDDPDDDDNNGNGDGHPDDQDNGDDDDDHDNDNGGGIGGAVLPITGASNSLLLANLSLLLLGITLRYRLWRLATHQIILTTQIVY